MLVQRVLGKAEAATRLLLVNQMVEMNDVRLRMKPWTVVYLEKHSVCREINERSPWKLL